MKRYFLVSLFIVSLVYSLPLRASVSPDEATVSLNEALPEVIFARTIEKAVPRGREHFLRFLSLPERGQDRRILWMYHTLRTILQSGGRLVSVYPANAYTRELFSDVCARPFTAVFKGKKASLELTIGMVAGSWKILIK